MHITELRIRHFRNFMKAKFIFREGVNTLIGENGSGKTNALYALRILLDESLTRNSVHFQESEFCRDLGLWHGHWIAVSIDFADLDSSENCQNLRHTTAHMNGTNAGTYSFFFRPKGEVRKKLNELSKQTKEIEQYLSTITVDDYEPVWTGRAQGNFLDDQIYTSCVGDFEKHEFSDPDNDDQQILGVRTQPIFQEIACTFVPALRDVIAELHSYRNNPLLTLLRGMESSIKISDSQRITNKVAELNKDISSLQEIKELAMGIESTLHNAVGYTFAPSIIIESALPDSMEKLLQRLNVLVGDNITSDYKGELYEQSLGSVNLIYIALKLLEYESKLSSDRVAHFLLIEEPEAHIHTHIQKSLFSKLPSSRTQVIVSTHSTHISSASKIDSVNVLGRNYNKTEVYQPSNGLDSKMIRRVERYLDAVRSTLLFAKGVLLVEGEAEQIMIPAMLYAVFGITPDELGFSVINMNSAFFTHVAIIFADNRIQRPCAIVTDLDKAFVELPKDPENDSNAQSHARKAQEFGKIRHDKLEKFITDNQWVKAFYSINTFEVEFLNENNSWEVVRTLDEIFKDEGKKERSKIKIKSSEKKESSNEILRIADKFGKGWYSILLSEKLCIFTNIPDYILHAIAFACHQSVDDSTIMQMGLFRLKDENISDNLIKAMPKEKELHNMQPSEFIRIYISAAPDDELSKFYNYLIGYRKT